MSLIFVLLGLTLKEQMGLLAGLYLGLKFIMIYSSQLIKGEKDPALDVPT